MAGTSGEGWWRKEESPLELVNTELSIHEILMSPNKKSSINETISGVNIGRRCLNSHHP